VPENTILQEFRYPGLYMQILRERRNMPLTSCGSEMETRGAGVSAARYLEVELGRFVPEDIRRFLVVFARVLRLTQDELLVLLNLMALAVLSQNMDEGLARESLMHALISI
jgi:hypothetical protein